MRVLSADAALLSALKRRGYRGRVHSVFERVVNVENACGDLLTIAARDLDDAPRTLVVDAQRFAGGGVRVGDFATACPDAPVFFVGPYALRLDAARAWNATLPRYPAVDVPLRRNVARVRARIAEAYRTSFAGDGAQPSGLARAAMILLDRRAAALGVALRRHDPAAAVTAGRAMLGLGPGLTPCGDDFLVGLFAVLHMAGSPCGHLRRVCGAIAADARQRTNAISAAALDTAARGHVRQSIVLLIGALLGARREPLPDALSRVLAIGSTSGAAIARGVVAGFDVSLQSQAANGAGAGRAERIATPLRGQPGGALAGLRARDD